MQEPIPQEVVAALNGETKDFAVKASRSVPLANALVGIMFGFLVVGLTSFFWFKMYGPILQGQQVHFTVNHAPAVAGPGNLKPLLMPTVLISVFTIIGLALLWSSIQALILPGPWFAGTATRLIIWKPGSLRSVDWESFSGTSRVSGDMQNATITFEMRTGRMVRRKNGPSRYVPDLIYMVGIENAIRIDELCRKRIKENDPTPTNG